MTAAGLATSPCTPTSTGSSDASAAVLRAELARRTGLPTTFGWAPRCLTGSGQHAKGGPPDTRVCQLTADPDDPGLRPEAAAALDAVQQRLAAVRRRGARRPRPARCCGCTSPTGWPGWSRWHGP